MKQMLVLILSILLSNAAYAKSGDDAWRWYYVAFSSPEKSADVFVRKGSASVKKTGSQIEINFREEDVPELAPKLIGHMSQGKVNGTLKGFFMYEESLALFGDARSSRSAKNCFFDEIVLRTKEPTGSMFVLSRVTGNCQP